MNPVALSALPEYILNYSLSFCHAKDIYFSLNLACKFLHQFISKSNYLSLHISLNSFGISPENIKSFSDLTDSELQKIFFTKLQNFQKIKNFEIPFYGFSTDGGVDSNSPEYWIDTFFMKGDWTICSKIGENFHIKGALCEKFEKVRKGILLFNEISQDLQEIFKYWANGNLELFENNELFSKLSNKFLIDILKKEIQKFKMKANENSEGEYKSSDEEWFPKTKKKIKKIDLKKKKKKKKNSILDSLFHEMNKKNSKCYYKEFKKSELLENLSLSMNVLRKTEVKWIKIQDSNEYEIFDDKLVVNPTKYAIIKGFEISRRGVFTCPVKTCMVFISDFDIDIKKTEIFGLFKEAKNIEEIKRIFDSSGEDLPSIYSTNCLDLKEKSINKTKPSTCSSDMARFIIFNNNKRRLSKEVRPIAWMQFTNRDLKELKVKLDKFRLFGGRYVVVKLIDCENRIAEFGYDENANIDINYVSFLGEVFDLKNSVLC